jgi:prevent-host-death family protein
MADRILPQRELRNHVSAVLREVERGGTFTVTVRDRPVARLVPAGSGPKTDVGREKLLDILDLPMDGRGLLEDLDQAEAPIE